MKNLLLYVGLGFLVLPLSGQAAIYKCVVDHVVTYQDTPCENADEAELIVASIRAEPEVRVMAPNSADAIESRAEPSVRSSPQVPGLALGMLDTQVLNMRGWGRPSKITRSKVNRAWREAWTYISPLDGQQRQLEFANGKLTAIE